VADLLSLAASVDDGDRKSNVEDAVEASVVVELSASLPRLDADPLAGASSCPSSAGASASSSSLAGVVVVAVSVSGGPDVDEPLGALGPPPAGALAAAVCPGNDVN
jgi:hypothetical protein